MRAGIPHFHFGSSGTCTYCGEIASTIDHVFPVSFQTINRKQGDKRAYGPTTPGCRHCNNVLSNYFFNTFLERCQHISQHLDKKAKWKSWTKNELNELNGKLKDYVIMQQSRNELLKKRANFLHTREFAENISDLLDQPHLDRYEHKYNEQLYYYFYTTLVHIKPRGGIRFM